MKDAKLVKVLAVGCYKRFVWLLLRIKGVEYCYCIRISADLYRALREFGVPTCQSMRKKK